MKFHSLINFFSKKSLISGLCVLEGLIFLLGVIFMLKRGVCNSLELDPIGNCVRHVPFLQKIGEIHNTVYLGYIDFFGSWVLVLAIFFLCTYILVNLFYSRFAKWQWYKKIFLVEMTVLLFLCFILTIFFTIFSGENIYQQLGIAFGLRILSFGLFFSVLLFFRPIPLAVLSVPYIVGLVVRRVKKHK